MTITEFDCLKTRQNLMGALYNTKKLFNLPINLKWEMPSGIEGIEKVLNRH